MGTALLPKNDTLTFSWSLTVTPIGSLATLSDSTAINPTFEADVFGTYEITLVVHDGQVASELDTVIISTINVSPIANAGQDQAVPVGDPVFLDGQGSTDPDGLSLTFMWSMVSQPVGSSATLSDPTSPTPDFVPNVAGTYLIQLMVNDGTADSEPDTASITAASEGSVPDLLMEAINVISSYSTPPTAFVNRNSPRALINKLEAVIRQVEGGSFAAASNQLTGDLLPKMDGCALRGIPDVPGSGEVRDWIITCEVQGLVYPLLTEATEILTIMRETPEGVSDPGDLDGDGNVDMDDLGIVVSCFGQTAPLAPPCDAADVAPPPDGDGVINILDISFVGSNFTP